VNVYKYKNYDEYIACQTAGYNKKIDKQWAVEDNIKYLCEYLVPMKPERGICHGVRQGAEQSWFNRHLPGCHTIGTELGGIIGPDTVQWDFNKYRADWKRQFDFLYSNSFDHAFDPEITLQIWFGQVKRGGVLMLEYDMRQEHTGEISRGPNKIDPVSITIEELRNIAPRWLPGVSGIEILDMPVVKKGFQKTIIIKKDVEK